MRIAKYAFVIWLCNIDTTKCTWQYFFCKKIVSLSKATNVYICSKTFTHNNYRVKPTMQANLFQPKEMVLFRANIWFIIICYWQQQLTFEKCKIWCMLMIAPNLRFFAFFIRDKYVKTPKKFTEQSWTVKSLFGFAEDHL